MATLALASLGATGSDHHSVKIPPEISSAVNPYLTCRLESLGATMTDPNGKRLKPVVKKGGDCSAFRTKAVTDADALLIKAGKSDADRSALIDSTMKSIDDFADEMRRAMIAAGEHVG